MATDERFDPIAGLAEQLQQDREENRQILRDTQRQINELTLSIGDLTIRVGELTMKITDSSDTITRLAEESRAADKRLEDRIGSLVSAISEFLTKRG